MYLYRALLIHLLLNIHMEKDLTKCDVWGMRISTDRQAISYSGEYTCNEDVTKNEKVSCIWNNAC